MRHELAACPVIPLFQPPNHIMPNLFRKKTLADILENSTEAGHTLKRTLGSFSLIALGIGAIIGAIIAPSMKKRREQAQKLGIDDFPDEALDGHLVPARHDASVG